ncbi:MAG: carbonic anhydrase [Actinobacteria bacterium]|nr:carbonic anhydrase [Actinomycetota bacterium]
MSSEFDAIFAANSEYVKGYKSSGLTGRAARGLAIITCMDSRIDPLRIVGMSAGDVKILRNAGARVTDDVLRTLIIATHLLNVKRILIMPHTDCRMVSGSEEQIHQALFDASGIDTRSIEIRTVTDQVAALKEDVASIQNYPLLPKDLEVVGAIFDVKSGELRKIV